MQNLYNVFGITTLIILPLLLNSCSSSSYYDRYGSKSSGKYEEQKNIEDEVNPPPSQVPTHETDLIIQKLSNVTNSSEKKEKFLEEIISYLNTPYRYGGESRRGIDCSAFTQKVYLNSLNVFIPRTAREQYKAWETFNDKDDLMFGDLIYFDTSNIYFPGHVGIYLDDNLFAHASSSKGVIVSSLDNDYYSNKFIGANRVKIKQRKNN